MSTGAIAPNSLGLWAITFVLGGLATWVAFLTLKHYNVAVPAYERLFGSDDDETNDGHLVDAEDRFNHLDDAHSELAREVDDIHDDVRKLERQTESVLSNQKTIADALDVDLERTQFYRDGRGSRNDD